MSEIKIGAKVTLGYLVLILILMVLVGLLSSLLFSINQSAQVLSRNVMPLVNDSAGLERALLNMSQELRNYGFTEERAYLERAKAFLPDIEANLKSMDDNLADYQSPDKNEVAGLLTGLKSQVTSLRNLSGTMESTLVRLDGARTEFTRLRDSVFTDHLYPFFGLIQDELAAAQGEDADAKARLDRYTSLSNSMWDNYEATNLTFWQGQARRSPGEISRAAELLKASLEDLNRLLAEPTLPRETLASGRDLAGRIPAIQKVLNDFIVIWGERDAIDRDSRELMLSVTRNLSELGTRAGRISAEGADQTRRNVSSALTASFVGLALTLALGLLCAFFISRGITGSIKGAINRILSGAGYVELSAGVLAEAAGTLSHGASRNASSLQDIAAALEELSAMTSRNSDNAGQADSLMQGARGDMLQAGQSMDSVVRAMDEISASGREISHIIKTIDEIAFQTNLLALNAAVEAARAGEAGSGFAVVAEEVRNLATRSAEAAKNTADLIDGTIKNISTGSELVKQAGEGFGRVRQNVDLVGNLLSEVAEASQEQSQGIGQISRSMADMDRVTQDNLLASSQAAGASSDLAGQAEELMDTVNQLSGLVYSPDEARDLTERARRESSRPVLQGAPPAPTLPLPGPGRRG